MRRIPPLVLLGTLVWLAACDTASEKAAAAAAIEPARTAPTPAPSVASTATAQAATFVEYPGRASASQHSNCSIDAINGRPPDFDTDAASAATFEGWAVNNDSLPANAIRLVLVGDKAYAVEASTGQDRPDVAAAVGKPAQKAGFRVAVEALGVPAGTYSARIEGADGSFSCATRARIVVN